jgi:Kdo2-lipid IVA lauroyltransferase/acyltransferase
MAKPRNMVLDYLQYLGLRVFAMFVHMFSLRANYRTGRLVGNLMFRFDRRHRRRAVEHLRRSFPDWPERRYQTVARASMRNMVYMGLEFLLTTRLISHGNWRRYVQFEGLGESLRLVLERKSGVILITGHFGNWEVAGYAMAALGFPTISVARRLDNPYIDRYVLGTREQAGQRILDKQGATAVVPGALERKETVCFIADQDAGQTGVFVDFFGRKASTYKAIALMAMQHDAPVVVGYGRRLKEQFGFEIGTRRIIRPSEWQDKPNPMVWITQEYTRALEEIIREAPEQYLWVHRRWKHRPRGEERGPDGIA